MIKRVKFWCLVFFYIICSTCYVISDEKGIQGAARKIGRDIKWQIGLHQSTRVLDTVRYTSGLTFW